MNTFDGLRCILILDTVFRLSYKLIQLPVFSTFYLQIMFRIKRSQCVVDMAYVIGLLASWTYYTSRNHVSSGHHSQYLKTLQYFSINTKKWSIRSDINNVFMSIKSWIEEEGGLEERGEIAILICLYAPSLIFKSMSREKNVQCTV